MEPKIPGGYYIKARRIQKSEISRQPPHVREIWDWLLMNANHKDKKYGGRTVKRGQLFRTYNEIREGLAWYVGWRKMMYNENQTKRAMKFLREALMIDTKKEPGGVLITICNYELYQCALNYERTNERTIERTIDEPLTNQPLPYNNKNDKNGRMKECKEEDLKPKGEEKNTFSTDCLEIAQKLLDKNIETLPHFKKPTESQFNKSYCHPIRLMLERDKRPVDITMKILDFLITDYHPENDWPGWRDNIQSGKKFREKWEKVLKSMNNENLKRSKAGSNGNDNGIKERLSKLDNIEQQCWKYFKGMSEEQAIKETTAVEKDWFKIKKIMTE